MWLVETVPRCSVGFIVSAKVALKRCCNAITRIMVYRVIAMKRSKRICKKACRWVVGIQPYRPSRNWSNTLSGILTTVVYGVG